MLMGIPSERIDHERDTAIQPTQHAFLVAWGRFAAEIGLIEAIQGVKLKQKKYPHEPQTKVLEFLVATLAGLKQLQEISLAAHPLDKDPAVAEAWGHYTGVSRTLSSLSWEEVHELIRALEQVGQPWLQAELALLRRQGKRLRRGGDLTGIPVSNTSRTYPNAAFGHMDDAIRLGYQAGVVSLESPTYRRVWLSVAHHPGDTVSCTQAEALVRAAEARTGLRPCRPQRRTECLRDRIRAFREQMAPTEQRLHTQQQALADGQARLREAHRQVQERQSMVADLEQAYRARQRPERPTSHLAQARKRWQVAQKRCRSRDKALQKVQARLTKTRAQLAQQQAELSQLEARLARLEQDNRANQAPVEIEFRRDAGFGTYENLALLIELGYEVYTKPHSHQVVRYLKSQVTPQTEWIRVGDNAEMVAWPTMQLNCCPYPMNLALERFPGLSGQDRLYRQDAQAQRLVALWR